MKVKNTLCLSLVLGTCLFVRPSFSAETVAENDKVAQSKPQSVSKIAWNWFQFGGGAMFDSDGAYSGVTGLNWNPTLKLDPTWRLKLSFGGLVGNLGTGSPFLIGESVLSLIYVTKSPFWFEAGGGYQYWEGRRDFHFQARGGIGYRLWGEAKRLLEDVHTLHLSYSLSPQQLISVHQIMASFIFRI